MSSTNASCPLPGRRSSRPSTRGSAAGHWRRELGGYSNVGNFPPSHCCPRRRREPSKLGREQCARRLTADSESAYESSRYACGRHRRASAVGLYTGKEAIMIFARTLIQLALLVGLAGSIRADEFWGRRLPGEPTQFIFGYGSLINSSSRNTTASQPIVAIPAR